MHCARFSQGVLIGRLDSCRCIREDECFVCGASSVGLRFVWIVHVEECVIRETPVPCNPIHPKTKPRVCDPRRIQGISLGNTRNNLGGLEEIRQRYGMLCKTGRASDPLSRRPMWSSTKRHRLQPRASQASGPGVRNSNGLRAVNPPSRFDDPDVSNSRHLKSSQSFAR